MCRGEWRETFAAKLWAALAGRQALGFELEFGMWVGEWQQIFSKWMPVTLALKGLRIPRQKLVMLIQGRFRLCELLASVLPSSIYLVPTVLLLFRLFSCVWFFVMSWTAAPHQSSLSFSVSQNLLKLMSIESMMLSNHLIHCHHLLLLSSVFPSISILTYCVTGYCLMCWGCKDLGLCLQLAYSKDGWEWIHYDNVQFSRSMYGTQR